MQTKTKYSPLSIFLAYNQKVLSSNKSVLYDRTGEYRVALRLLEAAPDLLQTCKIVLALIENRNLHDELPDGIRMLKAAIADAEREVVI